MTAKFEPSVLSGRIEAPPSKSMAHRYLICSALSGESCTLSGVDFSEDILASIDCLKALGADIDAEKDVVRVEPGDFMKKAGGVKMQRKRKHTALFYPSCSLSREKRRFARKRKTSRKTS